MKPKLTIEGQVKHMQSKGIQFNITSESQARAFLRENTYYFKLKSFAKNYDKKESLSNPGSYVYINLEFAYLQELAVIDMHLRKLTLKTCLDIEHFLKVKMLSDASQITEEDGYDIVEKYFSVHPNIKNDIEGKAANSYCKDLVNSYSDNFAIWNIVEVLTFSQFSDLYRLFYGDYPGYLKNKDELSLLKSVKWIRNASAHNNCLLNSLKMPYSRSIKPTFCVNEMANDAGISKKIRDKKLGNPVIHDLSCMLMLLDLVASDPVKKHLFVEYQELFSVRVNKNVDFFTGNPLILSHFHFLKTVIDFLADFSI